MSESIFMHIPQFPFSIPPHIGLPLKAIHIVKSLHSIQIQLKLPLINKFLNSKNNTEIIFTRPYPKATVRERVNKFFKPVNLANVAINRNGTGTVIIKAIPSSTPPAISYSPAGSKGSTNYEGAAESKSPPSYAGTQAVISPRVTSFNTTNADASKNEQGQPVEVESAEIVTIPMLG